MEVPSRSFVEPDLVRADVDAVLGYLRSRAGVWVPARDAARDLGMSVGGTEPRFRRAVRILTLRGFPVVAGARGYCFLDDAFAVAKYVRGLERRAAAIHERAARLRGPVEGASSPMMPAVVPAGTGEEFKQWLL